MTPATLERPPRPQGAPAPPGPGPRRRAGTRALSGRRPLLAGLVVSALLHLLVLGTVQFSLGFRPQEPAAGAVVRAEEPGMRVVQLRLGEGVPEDVAAREPERVAPPPGRRVPANRTPGSAEPRAGEPAEAAGAVERLRPSARDPRLWSGLPSDRPRPLTPEEAVDLRLRQRIQALNDSIAGAVEAARAATDWTYTDESGRRWGISPEGLHLGGVTLPVPIVGQSSHETRAELERRQRQWEEIQAQAGAGERDEGFDERVRAIRERRARERNESGEGGGG